MVILLLKSIRSTLCNTLISTEEKHPLIAGEIRQEPREEIHSSNALGQALPRSLCHPDETDAVGHCEVCGIEHITKRHIPRCSHEHLAIGRYHMVCCALVEKRPKTRQRFLHSDGSNRNAEKGDGLHATSVQSPGLMRRLFFSVGLLLLTACVPSVPQQQEPTPQPSSAPSSAFPTAEHDSQAVPLPPPDTLRSVSGALLSNGVFSIGMQDAPAVLLVFTNHACRYCREFLRHHLPRLIEEFVTSGQLRIDIALRPLMKYPESERAARALICAAWQDKGMEMNAALPELSPLTDAAILGKATTIGLDAAAFTTCLDADGTNAAMRSVRTMAETFAVDQVPTFYLNGNRTIGLPDYADVRATVRAALEG